MPRSALQTALDIAAEHRARVAALEAENAALREVAAAVAKASEGIILGHGEADHEVWTLFLKIGDLRRARALVRGQGGADHG